MKCPKCRHENPPESVYCGKCAIRLGGRENRGHVPDSPGSGTRPPSSPRPAVTKTLETTTGELARGTVFAGRYEIIEELGVGGMGKVYRVHDARLNEEVALKLIKPEIAAERRVVERFRNEIKIARQITHKNVCRTHDLHEEGTTLFLTMEYVRGEDLKSLIHRTKTLSAGTAVSIVRQAAEGLAEAHRLGIVHRDLKPGNIMIDRDGNAKIMDFGIARVSREPGVTGEGAVIGTLEYMSPEQVEGKDVDARSDIYSLGAIFFEMVTGRPPFEGETAFGIANKHRGEPAPDPQSFNPQVPADLARLVLHCLEKDPEQRFQTADELVSGIAAVEAALPSGERAAAGRPPTRPKPATSRKVTLELTPRKLLFPALAVLAVTAIAIGLLTLLPKRKAVPPLASERSVAVLPFRNMSTDGSSEYLADGMSDALIGVLGRLRDLRVPGRTSTFSFKGREVDVGEVGRKLNVRTVLEGSVQVIGDRLRITAGLIDAKNGFQIWTERYDRKMEDFLDIQDEIATAIADKLEVKLLGKEKGAIGKRSPADQEAYNLFLRGRELVQLETEAGLRRGSEYLERAAARDPDFAEPLAALGMTYVTRSYYGKMRPHDVYPKAREFARRALERDASSGLAFFVSGAIKTFYDWDWPGAEVDFEKALELSPNSPDVHLGYAWLLTFTRRPDEAVLEAKTAQGLDPLSGFVNTKTAQVLYWAGRTDEAFELVKEAILLNPADFQAHNLLGLIYHHKSMDLGAMAEFEKAAQLSDGDPFALLSLARTYDDLDRSVEAKHLRDRVEASSGAEYVPPTANFYVHLGRKEIEQAAAWLEKACAERDGYLPWCLVHPNLQSRVPDLPIFNDILKKHGL